MRLRMNKLNMHFMELKNEELSCVLGGGQREGNAVLAGAAGAVEAAMSCAPAGPYAIAACAVGGAIYGGFWGYVFGS